MPMFFLVPKIRLFGENPATNGKKKTEKSTPFGPAARLLLGRGRAACAAVAAAGRREGAAIGRLADMCGAPPAQGTAGLDLRLFQPKKKA